jgi:hypothetical protein
MVLVVVFVVVMDVGIAVVEMVGIIVVGEDVAFAIIVGIMVVVGVDLVDVGVVKVVVV